MHSSVLSLFLMSSVCYFRQTCDLACPPNDHTLWQFSQMAHSEPLAGTCPLPGVSLSLVCLITTDSTRWGCSPYCTSGETKLARDLQVEGAEARSQSGELSPSRSPLPAETPPGPPQLPGLVVLFAFLSPESNWGFVRTSSERCTSFWLCSHGAKFLRFRTFCPGLAGGATSSFSA